MTVLGSLAVRVARALAARNPPPAALSWRLRPPDLHPAHRSVPHLLVQPPDPPRSQHPDLGRPGGRIGDNSQSSVREAVRPSVRGQIRADNFRPPAEY